MRPHSTLPFDVHLMIAPVDPYIEAFAKAGADIITVHAEAGPHLHRTLQAIRALGQESRRRHQPRRRRSARWNTCSTASTSILLMTVNPGFGGQAFIPEMVDKVRAREGARSAAVAIDIEIDGGMTPETAPLVAKAGANVLVAGSPCSRAARRQRYKANIAGDQAMPVKRAAS